MKCIVTLAMLVCSFAVGCGAPLYPERTFSVNPRTGQVTFSSTQEEDLVIGAFTATDSPTTGKSITLGTTTQPAVVYGAKSVGAMAQYALQQEQYGKILDIIGKNTTDQINALGSWIPGIASMLTGAGIPKAQVDAALQPCNNVLDNLKLQAALAAQSNK